MNEQGGGGRTKTPSGGQSRYSREEEELPPGMQGGWMDEPHELSQLSHGKLLRRGGAAEEET